MRFRTWLMSFTGCAIIQFPEMVSSIYHSMRLRRGRKKPSAPNEWDEKKVEGRKIQRYKDIRRLKQLVNAKRSKLVLDSSMKERMECLTAENATLIEIVARIIGRIDKLESNTDQIISKIYDINNIEETSM